MSGSRDARDTSRENGELNGGSGDESRSLIPRGASTWRLLQIVGCASARRARRTSGGTQRGPRTEARRARETADSVGLSALVGSPAGSPPRPTQIPGEGESGRGWIPARSGVHSLAQRYGTALGTRGGEGSAASCSASR